MGTVKAVAIITGDQNVRGSLQFVQDPNGATHVKGRITGLTPGFHGFHIHALGDTTNGCNSTGPHFNPLKKDHGAPSDEERHAGDLGNIVAGPDGVAEVSIRDMQQISLSGQHSILGRAVVVHADPDDLGRGGHELSKTTGNAGARVGCEPKRTTGPTLLSIFSNAVSAALFWDIIGVRRHLLTSTEGDYWDKALLRYKFNGNCPDLKLMVLLAISLELALVCWILFHNGKGKRKRKR